MAAITGRGGHANQEYSQGYPGSVELYKASARKQGNSIPLLYTRRESQPSRFRISLRAGTQPCNPPAPGAAVLTMVVE